MFAFFSFVAVVVVCVVSACLVLVCVLLFVSFCCVYLGGVASNIYQTRLRVVLAVVAAVCVTCVFLVCVQLHGLFIVYFGGLVRVWVVLRRIETRQDFELVLHLFVASVVCVRVCVLFVFLVSVLFCVRSCLSFLGSGVCSGGVASKGSQTIIRVVLAVLAVFAVLVVAVVVFVWLLFVLLW